MSILVLYYSKHGSTRQLASVIANGVESAGVEAVLRQVPNISTAHEASEAAVPDTAAPYATLDDLAACSGLALGCPTHFGNMPAAMKHFIDQTTALWLKGSLIDKPAAVFTSSSSMHGGQESTLLSMMLPLLHHGMLIQGVPYSEQAVHQTLEGGGPYGASCVMHDSKKTLSTAEKDIALALGKRLATMSKKLCPQ